MCGIAGIVRWRNGVSGAGSSTDAGVLGDQIRAMVASLAHRGPDDEGIEHQAGVALGMRRLAILGLGPAGHQPMSSDDGQVTVVFNGEIYNHLDLRSRLGVLGQSFRGTSDTETLVHGYHHLGIDALVRALSGMYAFAVLDRRRGKLLLARDEFGVKPLYLRRGPGQIAFASEIRAFAHDGQGRPGAAPDFVGAYLHLGWVPSPVTAFAGVTKLGPGTILEIDLATGEEQSRRFYRLQPEAIDVGLEDDDGVYELFRQRLNWVIRRQLISDVPVGVFLSGGLDSSAILTLAAPHLPEPPSSFSVGFSRADIPDETVAAAIVARRVGGEHVVLSLDPTTLDDLAPIQAALEEPLADSALLPLWHLCRGTAAHVKVALSGEGGDEALGGYTRYFWGYAASALSSSSLGAGVVEQLGRALPRLPPRTRGLGNLARRVGKFIDTLALPEAERYLRWFEVMTPDERRAITGSDASPVTGRVQELFAEARAAGLDVVQCMQYVDVSLMLLDNLLVKADKLSMAHGLEVRVPLLDRKLVELGLGLPARAKIGVRGNKPLLRRLLAERLPRSITRGGKRGFEIPVDRWFRDASTAALRLRLSGGTLVRTLGFSAPAIRRLVDRHLAGEDLGRKLFALTMLEFWADRYA